MSSSEQVVVARGLSKKYVRGLRSRTRLTERLTSSDPVHENEFWALRDVSFDVAAGTIAGFIGPNGAGKSTLLKILARVTPPTAGTATMVGRVASLIEVGTGFHQELTGRENIFLSAAIHGMSRQLTRQRLNDIVEFAGVEDFIDTPVKRYSSGMYVRLGFSIAVHVEPEILIVDEILAVGDAAFQIQCLDRVSELKRAGTAIIWVSHDLDQVQRLCDSVSLLDHGVIVHSGGPFEIVGSYRNIEGHNARGLEGVAEVSPKGTGVEILRVEPVYPSSIERAFTGEPFGIEVEAAIHSPTPIEDLNVGIWIHDSEGKRLLGTNTQSLRCRVPEVSEGRLQISFRFGYTPLRTGSYVLSAAVEGTDGFKYAQAPRASILHVVDDGSTIGRIGFVPIAAVEVMEDGSN